MTARRNGRSQVPRPLLRGRVTLRLGILAMALLVIAGFLAARGSDSEEPAAAVRITSPALGATVSSPMRLEVSVTGTTLGYPGEGLDHLHVSVDADVPLALYETPQLTLPLDPGRHTVAVELAGPDHRPLLPAESVSFSIAN